MHTFMRSHSRLFLWIGLLVLVGWPAEARAIGPGVDLYLGYSRLGSKAFYSNSGSLNGWQASADFHFLPLFSAEADVSHYGLGAAASVPHTTVGMVGPRLTLGAAGVHVFAHGLVGMEHSSNEGGVFSANALTVAAGGGIDFHVLPFFSWRFTGDYITAPAVSPGNGNHERFGTGLVFHF